MVTGGSSSTKDETGPQSLKDLQLSRERVRKKLQTTESSREFHLAMWKSAPYAFIAAISALALTFFTSLQPEYVIFSFHLPVYSVGPIIVAALVAAIGIYGGLRQGTLGEKIAELTIGSEAIEKQLERRTIKVEAEIINSRPSGTPFYHENFIFSEQLNDSVPIDTTRNIVPLLLDDMKQLDKDLVELMSRLHESEVDIHNRLVSFYDAARSELEALDQAMGLTSPQPAERQSSRIKALYLVLGGLVTSPLDVQQLPNKNPKVRTRYPEEGHFIQLLYDKTSSTNPYPSLLNKSKLGPLAVDCEKSRTDGLAAFTVVDRIITVKYMQPAYHPGV